MIPVPATSSIWMSFDVAVAAIVQRVGCDVAAAADALLTAARDWKITIRGVPHAHDGTPISPAVAMPPAALASAVLDNGNLMERWSDGRLRVSRWHQLEVRASDIDRLWPATTGVVATRKQRIIDAAHALAGRGLMPRTAKAIARAVCDELGFPRDAKDLPKGFDPQTIMRTLREAKQKSSKRF